MFKIVAITERESTKKAGTKVYDVVTTLAATGDARLMATDNVAFAKTLKEALDGKFDVHITFKVYPSAVVIQAVEILDGVPQ